MSRRVSRMCQEVPNKYGISNRDNTQLVRGEAHLANWLTVAYEHLIEKVKINIFISLQQFKLQTASTYIPVCPFKLFSYYMYYISLKIKESLT